MARDTLNYIGQIFRSVTGPPRDTLHMSTSLHRLDLYVNDSVNQGT